MNLFHRQISKRIFIHWAWIVAWVALALAMIIRSRGFPWSWIYLCFLPFGSSRQLPGKWMRTDERSKRQQMAQTTSRTWLVWAKRLTSAVFWFSVFYMVVMWNYVPTLVAVEAFLRVHDASGAAVGIVVVWGFATIAREFFYFRNVPESDVIEFLQIKGMMDLPLRDRYKAIEENTIPVLLSAIRAKFATTGPPRILTPGKVYAPGSIVSDSSQTPEIQ